MAYFDQKGSLKGSPTAKLTEVGELRITDLFDDVDMHQSSMRNITSLSVKELSDVHIASVDKLFVGSGDHAAVSPGSIVLADADGSISYSKSMSETDGTLHVKTIGAHVQTGDVDFTGSGIVGAHIMGGKATGLSEVSTSLLTIGNTSVHSDGNRMLSATPRGQVQRDDPTPIAAHSVIVDTLEVKNSLMMGHSKINGAILDNVRLATSQDSKTDSATLIGTDSSGKLVHIPGVIYKTGIVQTSKLSVKSIDVDLLLLSSLKNSVVSTDEYGKVVASTGVDVDTVSTSALEVSGKAALTSLQLSNLTSTVLFADANGNVVSARDTSLGSIEADSVSTSRVTLKGAQPGAVLATDTTGTVQTTSSVQVTHTSTATAAVGRLSVDAMLCPKHSLGFLSVDRSGNVVANEDISGKSVTSERAFVKEMTVDTLSFTGVSTGAVLSVNEAGVVTTTNELSVQSLNAHDALISDSATVGTLYVKSLGAEGVVGASKDGSLGIVRDVMADSLTSTTLSVNGQAAVTDLRLVGVTKEGVLTADDAGNVQTTTTIHADTMTASKEVKGAAATFTSLTLPGLQSTVLAVDNHGVVGGVSELRLDSLQSTHVSASKGTFDSLHLSTAQSESGLLTMASDGHVTPATEIDMKELTVSGDATVSGTARVGALVLGVDTVAGSVLVANADGEVMPQGTLDVSDVATGRLTTSGEVEAASFKFAGDRQDSPSLLAIDKDGTFVAAESVMVPSLAVESLSVVGKGSFGSLQIANMAAAHSPLSVNEAGDLVASTLVKVDGLSAVNGDVKTLSVGKLTLAEEDSLSEKTTSRVLLADAKGNVVPSKSLVIDGVEVDSLKVTGGTDMSTVTLPLRNALLSTDATGVVHQASAVDVKEVTASSMRTQSLSVHSLQLHEAAGGLLVVDSGGHVSTMSEVRFDKEAAALVAPTVRLTGLERGGLLTVDDSGAVSSTRTAYVDAITTGDISVHSTLTVSNVVLGNPVSSLLATDEYGKVVASTGVDVDTVSTSALEVSGKAALTSLQLSNLTSTVLFADANGNVVSARDTSLGSMEADSVSTSRVTLKGAQPGAVLTTDTTGTMQQSSDLTVSTVSTGALDVTNEATISTLRVSSLSLANVKATSDSPELLTVDALGAISAVPRVATLRAESGIFQTVSAETTSASSFQFTASTGSVWSEDSLMTIDKRGYFQASDNVKVTGLSVMSQLNAHGHLSVGSATVRNHPSSVLGTSAGGDLIPVQGLTLAEDGTVEIKAVKISALRGDISLDGHAITDATLSGSNVVNSEIYIDSKTSAGIDNAVVVMDSVSGYMSTSCTLP